jgi:hypothetical protein
MLPLRALRRLPRLRPRRLPRPSWPTLLLATAALAACSYELHVAAADTRSAHPRFDLGTSAGEVHAVAVNELRVLSESDGQWDWRHPVWCIGMDPGSYVQTPDIRYGSVPPGFTECAPPQVLQRGQHYLVAVSGAGVNGTAEFTAGE